jgi:hypothetical protein
MVMKLNRRLSLGGGFGALSGKYGHVIDNIVEVTVVTADGRVLKANKDENEDVSQSQTFPYLTNSQLFFGVRGGGCNFGVITQFTMRIHPVPLCWGGFLVYPMSQLETLSQALQVWNESIQNGNSMAWFMLSNKCTDGQVCGLSVTTVSLRADLVAGASVEIGL